MNVSFWNAEYLGLYIFIIFRFEAWQKNEKRDEAIDRLVFKRDMSLGT